MSRSSDLISLFASLSLPNENGSVGRFVTHSLPGSLCCALGKDASGYPVLLIATDDSGSRSPISPMVLENLSVLHNVDGRVSEPAGGTNTRRFSVVRCTGSDPVLHQYFLRTLVPVIDCLTGRPTRQQVEAAIHSLVELFRSADLPPRKTTQGLWAELFVICNARDPQYLVSCWHGEANQRFDFASDTQRLEVKSVSGRLRMHHFSHEQLRPPSGTLSAIASILMEPSTGGQNIDDLIDEIRVRVSDPSLLVRIDTVVAQTLGSGWRVGRLMRFDRQLALESLRFLDARTITSVPSPLPPEITEVHFCVDLTTHALNRPFGCDFESGLFEAMLPP